MRTLLAVILAFLSSGVVTGSEAQGFEISHLKVGLACIKTTLRPNQDGWVCHPTKDIYVVDQGECIYDNRKLPCTWTGIEFDYKGAKPGAKLACAVTSSSPFVAGNPRTAAKLATKQFSYDLPLNGTEGHRFEAQYSVFEVHEVGAADITQSTKCTLDGHVVLAYDQVIHYPTNSG